MDRTEPSINRILEEASHVVRRCKEATGKVEPAEGYKKSQIEELKKYTTANQLWIDFKHTSIVYLDKGGENEVFYDGNASVLN